MAADFSIIKTLAKEKGITLNELAKRVGMTPTGLGILIKSTQAMTNNVEAIAKELKVPIGIFWGETEQKPQAEATSDLHSIIAQKDAIIAQKDEIIAQKDAIINILTKRS